MFAFVYTVAVARLQTKKERKKRDDINNLIGTSSFKGYFHYIGFIIIYRQKSNLMQEYGAVNV